MSAPITETFRYANYPTEPDPSAPDDVALPVADAPTDSGKPFPWWGYPAILLCSVIVVMAMIVAWGTTVLASSPVQSDTYVQQDKYWPQEANKTGCYLNEVEDAAGACVDRLRYKRAIASFESQLKQGKAEFTSWASRRGFVPTSEKTLVKYLCTAAYNSDGAFYVANQIGLSGAPGLILSEYKTTPGGMDKPQVLIATLHLPYVSGPMVALATCPVVPSWARK